MSLTRNFLTNEQQHFKENMENIKDHKNLKLVTGQEKYAKYVMKPNFKDGK